MPYVYNQTCQCNQWVSWLSTLIQPTNSTSSTSALIHSTLANPYLPPILLMITVFLYIILVIAYQSSPGRGKLLAISTIVLIISLFESGFGFLGDAIIAIIVFLVALILTTLFQSN